MTHHEILASLAAANALLEDARKNLSTLLGYAYENNADAYRQRDAALRQLKVLREAIAKLPRSVLIRGELYKKTDFYMIGKEFVAWDDIQALFQKGE